MRQSMGKAYGALLTAFCACAASAADFTVAAGSPRTMPAAESSIAYGAVTVDDDLTLNGSAIGLTNLSSIVIGENATHPVTIVVTNGAKWIVKPDQTMKFTGKGGTLVVSAPSLQTFGWGTNSGKEYLELEPRLTLISETSYNEEMKKYSIRGKLFAIIGKKINNRLAVYRW